MAVERQSIGQFDINVWSEGTGEPLLFLHGYERHPGGAGFLTRLAKTHRVLAPEQPGYGSSTGFDQIRDITDLVLFYRSLIGSWGITQVDVVGHSMGGMVAAELAALAPQVVRRLVLVDSFGLWLDDLPALDPFASVRLALAAKWHDPENRPDPEPTIFVPDPDDPDAAALFEAQNRATATKFMWPMAERGLRRRLKYVTAPTLVVHGASDGLLPLPYAEEMVSLISGARFHVIDGAGHYPMIEQEDAFVAVVNGFLSGSDS
jgi:pimeloyl-ACP methyl ester carboxylesterase